MRTRSAMPSIWETNGGVYLGHEVAPARDKDRPLEGVWPANREQHRYGDERHIVTLGPNGSGKTRGLLVPNLYYLTDWSMLVVDPKGDLALWTAKHRRDAGSEVITLDPFGVIAKQYPGLVERQPYLASAGLNPLAALDPTGDDFPDDAKAIGEALIKVETQNEAYWAKSAQALIAGLVMGARLEYGADASMPLIRDWVGSAPEALSRLCHMLIDKYGEEHPGVAAKLNRFTEISPENRELLGILSTAITHTDWLDSKPIQRDLTPEAGGSIRNTASMKSRPVTIYLILPPRYLESHATWLRLIITAIMMPLIRSTGGQVPVLLMLDEFAQLGRLEVVERNMAMMRGYGIKLWSILQDLAQLKDNYEKRWESFLSNAGVRQAYAPQDVTTQEYLSKLSGLRMYRLATESEGDSTSIGGQFSQGKSVNRGEHLHQGPVWSLQALGMIEPRQGVLFWHGRIGRAAYPDPSEMPGVSDMLRAAEAAARE